MGKPTYVLGTGLSHDGSVCLLADGVVAVAVEKERLTRRKHDGGNDRVAMRYVLDAAGITLSDVALVVQNENFGSFRGGNARYDGEPRLLSDDGDGPRVLTISHHLAHAYSALGPCPLADPAVLVVDGCGNSFEDCVDVGAGPGDAAVLASIPPGLGHQFFEKDSYYAARGGSLRTVAKDFSPWTSVGWPLIPPTTLHSIGGVYHAFSTYVFGGVEDAGKLMGLAPYGRLGRFRDDVLDLRDGRVHVDRDVLSTFRRPALSRAALKADFEYYADVARWVQDNVERALLHLVRDRFERAPARNLAYAGGVALNAVANRRLLAEGPFEAIYVQPAAGDNGLALGCAYYGWLEVLGGERARPPAGTYFGRSYESRGVEGLAAAYGDRVTFTKADDVVEVAAALLAEGKTVGWFQGGAEFGPRALGHRSILAHPGLPGLRDHINRSIKFREDFRPFAPAVTVDDAERYFETGGCESPFMLMVFTVRPEWAPALANVTHVDGSARVQTVRRESEPRFYSLLREFERHTRLPVLLNTSLNKRGMPIVETPEEAVELFLESALDALVIDDHLVLRRFALPAPDRIRGVVDVPDPLDVPLVGARVAGVTLRHAATPAGLVRRAETVEVTFNDSPATLALAAEQLRLLELATGGRTYVDIAEAIALPVSDVVSLATPLARQGVLDHAPRPAGRTPLDSH